MTERLNPYQPGVIPSTRAGFFGRVALTTWLEQQIIARRRAVIVHGPHLIGKTTYLAFVPELLSSTPYIVRLSFDALPGYDINAILVYLLEQLQHQTDIPLPALDDPDSERNDEDSTADAFAAIDRWLAHLGSADPDARLFCFIDDLDYLAAESSTDLGYFLDVCQSLISRYEMLFIAFFAHTTALVQMQHPLLDTAPVYQLSVLTPNEAQHMITQPLEGLIRFDYGVPKRIAELNSNHPYYITLFNQVLFNRCARDGWVNLRHLDDTLEEVLDRDIAAFEEIWDESTWVERAVLLAMASVRGTHGVFTRQEVIASFKRVKGAAEDIIVTALESLSFRGVLVKMGALSYKFHVDLLRLWLQRRFVLEDVLASVSWQHPSARPEPARNTEQESEAVAAPHWRPWILAATLVLVLVLVGLGMGWWQSVLNASPPMTETAAAVSAGDVVNYSTVIPVDTPTPVPSDTPTPTPSPSPTAPIVVARTLPSVAYMARQGDAPWQLFVMNADGSERQALTSGDANDMTPAWSPAEDRLVFMSQRDGNREVYVADLTGESMLNLSNHPADDWTPSWSPDGSQVIFSSNRSGNWELFIVNADGSDLRQLTDTGNGNISPVWSPDGAFIAFSSKRDDNWEIYRMRSDGTEPQRLTQNEVNDLAPVWSPDGQLIAYETYFEGNVEVFVMDQDGGNQTNVSQTSFANDHGPVWTPDGQSLVFYSNREGNWDVFSMDLTGSNVVNLTNSPDIDEQTPVWRP